MDIDTSPPVPSNSHIASHHHRHRHHQSHHQHQRVSSRSPRFHHHHVLATNSLAPPLHATASEPALTPSVRRRPRASAHTFVRSRELGNHPLAYTSTCTSTSSTATATAAATSATPAMRLTNHQTFSKTHPEVPRSLLTWIEGTTLRRLDNGRYVTLDHPASLVRSTISIAFSHDGSLFASTHGDHTVKVFEYPSGKQVACLDGHPRTPWTVRFHPTDNRFIASGCLGYDCRIWDVSKATCIRRHTFRNSISCVSFSPDGDLLAVTSGRQLLLWDYWKDTRDPNRSIATPDNDFQPNNRLRNQQQNLARASSNAGNNNPPQDPGIPRELLEGDNPFHMVDFHPSGTMLMTGEKNRYQGSPSSNQSANGNNSHTNGNTINNNATAPTGTTATTNNNYQHAGANNNNQNNATNNNTNARSENQTNTNGNTHTTATNTTGSAASSSDEQQFTLKLVVHRFDRRLERRFSEPVLEVPRAVAYNDAGIHFSPCGTMLAACIPSERTPKGFRIAVLSLVPRRSAPVGMVLYETALDRGHVTALTNLKFSSTSDHLLAGFSFRPTNPVLRGQAETYDASVRQNELRMAQAQADAAGGVGRGVGGRGGVRTDDAGILDSPPPLPQVQVVDIYRVGQKFPLIRSLCADMDVSDGHSGGAEDEINVAVFAPAAGIADGVVYGTQKGRIRLFQLATGPVDKLEKIKGTVQGSLPRALQNRVPSNLAGVHRSNGPTRGHIRMQARGRALAAALHPNSNLTTSDDRSQIYAQQQGRSHPVFDVDNNDNNRTHHAARNNHHPQQPSSASRPDGSHRSRDHERDRDLGHVHYAPTTNSDASNQTTSGFLPHRNTIANTNNTQNNISNPVFDLSRMFQLRQFINANNQRDNGDDVEVESDAQNLVDGDGDVIVGDAEGITGRATAVLIDDDDEDTNNALDNYIQLEDPSVRNGTNNEHALNSHQQADQAQQSQTSVTHQPPQQPQSHPTSQPQEEPPRSQPFGFGRSAVGVGLGLLTQAGLFRRFRQVQMAATTTANNHNTQNEVWSGPVASSSAAVTLATSNRDGDAANPTRGNESRAFLQANGSSGAVTETSNASSAATTNCAAASNDIDHRREAQNAQPPPNHQQQPSAQDRRHNHPNNNLVPMYDNVSDGIAPGPTRHNSL